MFLKINSLSNQVDTLDGIFGLFLPKTLKLRKVNGKFPPVFLCLWRWLS